MLRNYLLTAWRNLIHNRVYSVINISGLGLGLACAMLIILYLKDELSFDRFHVNGDHIYQLYTEAKGPGGETRRMGITGDVQGPRFKSQIPEIKAFVRIQGGYRDARLGSTVVPQPILNVDSNFLSIFTFPLLSGNPASALSQPRAAVLSEDAATKYFGSTDVIGKILQLKMDSVFEPYTVTGVTRRCPQNSSLQFDVLLSKRDSAATEQGDMAWSSFFETTYFLLDPAADLKRVENKMTQVFIQDNPEMVKRIKSATGGKLEGGYRLQPFTDMHLTNNMERGDGITNASDVTYSYILSGIAFFILLIACINFVNLTMARSLKRAKEIGVRKVTGGTRKQLILQFLGESFILCAVAFILALAVVEGLLPLFNRLANKVLDLSYLFDVKLVCGYIALFLLTGFLAGFYPALVLSGFNPVETLYGRISLGGKNYLQKSLVILQFSLSAFLIGATVVLFSQFSFLIHKDLGYDDSHLVRVDKGDLTRPEARLLKSELMKDPDILAVLPRDGGLGFNPAKINGDSGIGCINGTIDESFLPVMKIHVVQGRNFSAAFPSDTANAVVVNESFVKAAGWKDPIGQKVSMGDKENYRVIGVIGDYAYGSLAEAIQPELLRMDKDYGMIYIKIKPGSETASLGQIGSTFRRLSPLTPFSYVFKDEENRKNYEAEEKWKQMLLFASVVTIFISCVGLFGLSVFSVEKRTKEIGVRKVLGASPGIIVALLSRDFLRLVVVSLVVAIPAVWIGADKWLQRYPYRVTLSGWMFAALGLAVMLIALVTVSFQAIRAGMANPVKSLRVD
ncbi:MAG TPA: ABC transporter permease [Puia sp.]|nr:ABC transporter permease [Puia sp.]